MCGTDLSHHWYGGGISSVRMQMDSTEEAQRVGNS